MQLALNLLAMLGQAGYLRVFQGLQIYITILAYGAGVDYCLFLIARYKEVLDGDSVPPQAAVAEALGDVGAALTASAATVMCGIGMMGFAQFGKFREAGFAIPLSLFLVLCATLTFSPALLRVAGTWAFWPHHRPATERPPAARRGLPSWFSPDHRFYRGWEEIGQILVRRPGTIWLATVAVMAPFVAIGCFLRNDLSYDMVGNLPSSAPSVAGTRLLQAHFPAGIIGPATLVLVDPSVDFRSPRGQALVKAVTDRLQAQRSSLGLADVRSLSAPLGITPAVQNALQSLPPDVRQKVLHERALKRYVADLDERTRIATRFDLVLDRSPFSKSSIEALNRVKDAVQAGLPPDVRPQAQLYLVGTTASVQDLQAVIQQDRLRVEGLTLAIVFVILVLLLRRFLGAALLARQRAVQLLCHAGRDAYRVLGGRSARLYGPRLEGGDFPVHHPDCSRRGLQHFPDVPDQAGDRSARSHSRHYLCPGSDRSGDFQLRPHHGGNFRLASGRLPRRIEAARLRPGVRRASRLLCRAVDPGAGVPDPLSPSQAGWNRAGAPGRMKWVRKRRTALSSCNARHETNHTRWCWKLCQSLQPCAKILRCCTWSSASANIWACGVSARTANCWSRHGRLDTPHAAGREGARSR